MTGIGPPLKRLRLGEPAFTGSLPLATFPPQLREAVRDQIAIITLDAGERCFGAAGRSDGRFSRSARP